MITPILIGITVAISILAFGNENLFRRLQLNPYQVYHKKQWYRVITHGFLHADWIHLLVNMIVLFSFGSYVENQFDIMTDKGMIGSATFHFLVLYFLGMVIATYSTIRKHRDNYHYNSIGASGAVSAVVFASILFAPTNTLLVMGIIPVPAIVFGVLYLIYSQYMRKRSGGNVNHDAHFIGAVFGFVYPIFLDPDLVRMFFNQIISFF